MNWRGTPLVDLATIVSLIGSTYSRSGLRVRSELDRGQYPGGITVTDAQLATVRSSGIAFTLAHLPRVKLRLGFVNTVGEQKGVDSLIVTDMITLARNRAMTDAVLLSGDEDLRVGVQQAQEFGVRVHLLGIRPSRGSQSLFLLQEADSTDEWGPSDLAPFLSRKPPAAPIIPAAESAIDSPSPVTRGALTPLERVGSDIAREILDSELQALVESIRQSGQIPQNIDARLLAGGGAALGARLDSGQKKTVRTAFVSACQVRLDALMTGR